MAAKPKLTAEQWAGVRDRWEADKRDGYSWLVEEMTLPVSAPAVRKAAIRDEWSKSASNSKKPVPDKKAQPKKGKTQASSIPERKVSKVSGGNHEKVSETIKETMPDTDSDTGGRSVGRPTLYREEYAEQAYKICLLLGATDAELAEFFEVDERTINNWKHDYPEFFQSIKKGKEIADAEVVVGLYKSATGYSHPDTHFSNFQGLVTETPITKHYPPNPTSGIFWMKNRQPKRWKDKVEIKEEINLNVFPPRDVLQEIFDASLKRSTEKAAILAGRRERLGIIIDQQDQDGD